MKKIARNQICKNYSADNLPLIAVDLGEIFIVETEDRLAHYEGPGSDDILKAMTGPIYINGVKPGDSIKVEFLEMSLPFEQGWIITTGRGPLSDQVPALIKKKVRITDRGVLFNDKLTLPLRPMISRVGVAPREGQHASIAKGEFGGAMGNPLVTKGAAVYLPVYHEGGLLSIGDGHAAQGDGEVSASAVECAVDVTIRVTKESRFRIPRPIVTTPTHVLTTGEGQTMEEAVNIAVRSMSEFLKQQLGVDETDSAMLMSSAGDVRFGLAGYPPFTICMAMPQSILRI
ncbi:acetamidase/formamidase family protein [Rhizobium sp. BR 315]|uniref:acetamidase/formamidase family protein n=1 Tax=Rhizobium sp. BR 315 TaxID=3040014 RepID=UPI003D32EFBE